MDSKLSYGPPTVVRGNVARKSFVIRRDVIGGAVDYQFWSKKYGTWLMSGFDYGRVRLSRFHTREAAEREIEVIKSIQKQPLTGATP